MIPGKVYRREEGRGEDSILVVWFEASQEASVLLPGETFLVLGSTGKRTHTILMANGWIATLRGNSDWLVRVEEESEPDG